MCNNSLEEIPAFVLMNTSWVRLGFLFWMTVVGMRKSQTIYFFVFFPSGDSHHHRIWRQNSSDVDREGHCLLFQCLRYLFLCSTCCKYNFTWIMCSFAFGCIIYLLMASKFKVKYLEYWSCAVLFPFRGFWVQDLPSKSSRSSDRSTSTDRSLLRPASSR